MTKIKKVPKKATVPQNKNFDIFTTMNYDFIPEDVIIIKDPYGWVFACRDGTKWYVNSTQDSAACPEKDNEKFIKKLVKAIKDQMKLI